MKKTILISATVLLAGCFSAKLLTPSQADVDRVKPKYTDYSLVELNQGKTLYEQHCSNCHGLKNPTSRTEEQWKEIVPRMIVKANKKEQTTLDAKTQESILRYVITMSNATPTK
jgi:mono/diheme cytochrome c family protein